MSLQALARFPVVVSFDFDPAGDDMLPVYRAPDNADAIIKAAYAILANDVAADTANYFNLRLVNAGTAGSGTTTIGRQIGGTAGWSGLTAVSFGAENTRIKAGEIVVLDYDEEGTGTFGQVTIQLDIVF